MIKTAIFDCDGTLLDSMGFWRSFEKSVADMAGAEVTKEQLDRLRAMSVFDAVRTVLTERFGPEEAEVMVEESEKPILDFYQNEVTERAGALEFVKSLKARGVTCAVLSASPPKYLEIGLARCGFGGLFDKIVSVDDFGETKHETPIWIRTLRMLDADPATTWGFEDSLYAIKIMRELGIKSVGLFDSDDAGSLDEMRAEADIAVRDYTELATYDFFSA